MNGSTTRSGWQQRASSSLYGLLHHAEIQRVIRDYGLRPDKPETIAAVKAFLQGQQLTVDHLSHLVVGSNLHVPIFDIEGMRRVGERRVIEVNDAATKRSTVPTLDFVHFLEIHRASPSRGSGNKATEMSMAFSEARQDVSGFFGASGEDNVFVFRSNTTNGINLLIRQILTKWPNSQFVLSLMSHHSNQLAARLNGPFEFFRLTPEGAYDVDSLEDTVKRASSKGTPVICIESQSNLTGYKNNLEDIAAIARRYHAVLLIDHAQGATDMPLNLADRGVERICAAVSGHKILAPNGSGGVVGSRSIFEGDECPLEPGGGTVSAVSADQVYFLEAPGKFEAGTQSSIPQMGFAMACRLLMEAGIEEISTKEQLLLRSFWPKLLGVEGLRVLGSEDLDAFPRGPVVSFRLFDDHNNPIPPGFIGYCLQLFGVECRVGQYCAHPYSYILAGATPEQVLNHILLHSRIMKAGCAALEGDETFHSTRFSWGFYTPLEDLLALPDMLRTIRSLWARHNEFFDFNSDKREFVLKGNAVNPSAGLLSPRARGSRRSYR